LQWYRLYGQHTHSVLYFNFLLILHPIDDDYNRGDYPRDGDHEESPPPPTHNGTVPKGGDSAADEKDLLDLDNWDDVPGQGPPGQPGSNPYQQGGPPPPQSPYQQGPPLSPYQQGGPLPGPSPYPQGNLGGYPPQQQQQEPNYAGAIVPTQAPTSYPGAPPYPLSQYPGVPSPYGPPQGGWQAQSPLQQQQQQQYNYAQPQPYQQQGF